MGRISRRTPWMRAVGVITLLAMTSCTVIREVPSGALTTRMKQSEPSNVDTTRTPGRWHHLVGYEDSHGKNHNVSGRVRAIPGDSLEFYLDNFPRAVTQSTDRSVIPGDSVSYLRLERTDPGPILFIVGLATGMVVLLLVRLSKGVP